MKCEIIGFFTLKTAVTSRLAGETAAAAPETTRRWVRRFRTAPVILKVIALARERESDLFIFFLELIFPWGSVRG